MYTLSFAKARLTFVLSYSKRLTIVFHKWRLLVKLNDKIPRHETIVKQCTIIKADYSCKQFRFTQMPVWFKFLQESVVQRLPAESSERTQFISVDGARYNLQKIKRHFLWQNELTITDIYRSIELFSRWRLLLVLVVSCCVYNIKYVTCLNFGPIKLLISFK